MLLLKYALSRTGLFPSLEPNISDFEKAADMVERIEHQRNDYWYIWPVKSTNKKDTRKNIRELWRLGCANGALMLWHYSRMNQEWVLRVRYRHRGFFRDVYNVKKAAMTSDTPEAARQAEIKNIETRRAGESARRRAVHDRFFGRRR